MALFQNLGWCPICEKLVTFKAYTEWLRDHYLCNSCNSIPRERALMEVLQKFYPNWRELNVHESSPSSRGVSNKLNLECKKYIATQYYNSEISLSNFRNEDLEEQTFENDQFDIVITQDVMEHVFDAQAAFKEIYRTLKKGGAHIFTTPLVKKNLPSECRAKRRSDESIDYIYPPEIHSNPISSNGSLVTWYWGFDIVDFISSNNAGKTLIFNMYNKFLGIEGEYVEVCITIK